MTGAMVLIEIILMRSMYGRNTLIVGSIASLIFLIASFLFIRNQTGIGDREFLKSMISHHASAILMCEQADIQSADIKQLCADIIASQESQIDWMKNKLTSLK
jgi:hypothetical protein